ncbi:MAG: dTMP kinase [Candidatus Altiarchaeota archaeon]|nr:dTMP kinase [Candidatus Altiarchaeota archaeon]
MFIVFEGVDGCGKSTHAKLLTQWLRKRGKNVFYTAEPTNGEVGVLIRKILSGKITADPKTLALLFTADRAQHVLEIEKHLRKGHIVVSDRYYHSTVAYQAAQGIDRNWLLKLNNFAPNADIVLYLDVSAKDAEMRARSGEIFEKKEFLAKVRREYMKFKRLDIVDATEEKKTVQDKIREIVSDALDKR